jgi:excinuclease ABC subunit C
LIPPRGSEPAARRSNSTNPVRCIEGIDIAHLQGGETVGSKVCFIDGRPFKDEYRRYRIKSFENLPGTPANDDYMSIREVVSRRYREAGDGATSSTPTSSSSTAGSASSTPPSRPSSSSTPSRPW